MSDDDLPLTDLAAIIAAGLAFGFFLDWILK